MLLVLACFPCLYPFNKRRTLDKDGCATRRTYARLSGNRSLQAEITLNLRLPDRCSQYATV